jgi:hypothetical protein
MIVRNVVLFPVLVAIVIHYERTIESSPAGIIGTPLLLAGVHRVILDTHTRSVEQSTLETTPGEAEGFPQSLGLRHT